MLFALTISRLRLCLAVLLTAVYLAAPIAEARHSEHTIEHICETAITDGAVASDKLDPPTEHNHHTHNCGSCHIHLLNKDAVVATTGRLVSSSPGPRPAEAVLNRPPGNTYRPPRG